MNHQDKIRLLHIIVSNLGLTEIPSGIVSRRLSIGKAFEENIQSFASDQTINLFRKVLNDEKLETVSASMILEIINENQDYWDEAFKELDTIEEPEDIEEESSGVFKEILSRNKYIPKKIEKKTAFLEYLLKNLISVDPIPYPIFEKEALLYLEPYTNLDDRTLIDEAIRRYIQIVYKDDPQIGYRLLFEEIDLNKNVYERLGLVFDDPIIATKGGVQRIMESMNLAALVAAGTIECRRIISLANKIAGVRFTEEEIYVFFKSYLDGSLDSIITKPPEGKSYFRKVHKTQDYKFDVQLKHFGPAFVVKAKGLSQLISEFMNILTRIKIIEWSQNVPVGEEKTILDILLEIQRDVLKIIPLSSENSSNLLSLEEMFQETDWNVIELVIDHFSNQQTFSYLLRLRKGGIRNIIFDSFKNLGGSTKTFGNQLLDIRNYYQVIFPDSWDKRFYYEFILSTASKGLSSSPKKTVRERLNLLVYPNRSKSSMISSKKISSDEIYETLKNRIPTLIPNFNTPDEAQNFFNKIFSLVKIILNRAWINKILRVGFELYIETPVQRVWNKEMIDLSRELIRYYQTLIAINQQQSKINELIFDSLTEALEGVPSVNESILIQETLTLFVKLPEKPVLLDSIAVDDYLDHAFSCAKTIINKVLGRKVDQEIERKTFDQEMDERITSLENKVNDWFIKGYQFYEEIISEPMSLEHTSNPNEILNKAIYGGIFFLIEESMKGLLLTDQQKIVKARFLKELYSKQANAIRNSFSKFYPKYNTDIIINFILEQIEIMNTSFQLREILVDLEGDNRLNKALGEEFKNSKDEFKNKNTLIFEPGIRSMIARELVSFWIKKWANSVINLVESCLDDYLSGIVEDEKDDAEQEAISLLFNSTGRNDIFNFIAPLLVGNTLKVLSFESCQISNEFFNETYTHEVFPETVQCDAQLVMYFLFQMISTDKSRFLKPDKRLDFIWYMGNEIKSSRQLLLGIEGETSSISDVVKKATGLSLSGLTLETIVFQFSKIDLFSAVSYCENPFEGSHLTGLALELISKELIPLNMLHPLTINASETIGGLFERNPGNLSSLDQLFHQIIGQLLDEAKLILLRDSGTIKDRKIHAKNDKKLIAEVKDLSRVMLKPTSAYRIKLTFSDASNDLLIPETVSYYGEKLINFNRFVHIIVPFFEPGTIIKNRLLSETIFQTNLEIKNKSELKEAIAFPSLAVFDDNGKYVVILGVLAEDNSLEFIITNEDPNSNMGLITIQYLMKTRDFEELTDDFGLIPLNELNRSFPLNQVQLIKEKDGKKLFDIDFINNIGLGAI